MKDHLGHKNVTWDLTLILTLTHYMRLTVFIFQQILDFGVVHRFMARKVWHEEIPRQHEWAHDGVLEYTSRDAHNNVCKYK